MKRPLFLVCFLLVVCTSFAYWNVDKCGFIDFDDFDYVCKNYHIFSGINAASLHWAFSSFHAANWHPLTWLSLMVDYQLYGLKPAGYHLTNLLFHVLNAIVLFFAIRALTGTLWRSALVAALFALHPLHVESVAWVSERKDVLCAFFMFITLFCYASFARQKQWGHYIATLFFFVMGILAKPMIVTLPFVLLLLDIWPLGRLKSSTNQDQTLPVLTRKNQILPLIVEKIPFFILSFASCIVTFLAQRAGEAIVKVDELPLLIRLVNPLISYAQYIEKMVWPKNLSFFYPLSVSMPSVKNLSLAFMLLLLISCVAAIRAKKQPYLLVGWLWFLGTLVPVIGFVQVGAQAMADRYTYIPLIGPFISIAWLLYDLSIKSRFFKITIILVSIVAIAFLTFQTRKQARYWKNDLTLSDHALAIEEFNSLAYSTKGHYLLSSGNYDEAFRCYAKSLSLCSTQVTPKINIGCIYFNQGKPKEALEIFKEILVKDPNNLLAIVDCGISYSALGDTLSAFACFSRALAKDSSFSLALHNLGKLFLDKGDFQKAGYYLLRASRLNPNDPATFCALAKSCFLANRRQEALQWYEKSISLNPYYVFARRQFAIALDSCGKHDLAQKQVSIADSVEAMWNVKTKK
jgi:tetratricopeptide (TPR) repeat protein